MTVDSDEGGGSGVGGWLGQLHIILWEGRWLILVPGLVATLAAVIAVLLLPKSYESKATLLVESQDLPTDVVENPDNTAVDRRIAKIRQRILARPDLVEIIQAQNLYNAASHREPLSTLVDRVRNATTIAAVDADIKQDGARANSSIAFSLSFDYFNPQIAQTVAQTFVDRLLKLDATETQNQAANGVRYLQDQEASLQQQLTSVEGQINQITGRNGVALANANGMPSISLNSGSYEAQIAQLQNQNAALRAQLGGDAIENNPMVMQAKAQLAAAKALYADNHPDVRLAETRVQAARQAAREQAKSTSAPVEQQIAANNAVIAQLNQARNVEQSRAATIAAAQARGPAVAQQVAQLQSKADVIRASLAKISGQLLQARSQAKLADEQRGERLSLIEPPATPDEPTSPNKIKLIGGAIAGGFGLGVLIVLLIEFIRRPLRSVEAVVRAVGVSPIGVVPILTSDRQRRRWFQRSDKKGFA